MIMIANSFLADYQRNLASPLLSTSSEYVQTPVMKALRFVSSLYTPPQKNPESPGILVRSYYGTASRKMNTLGERTRRHPSESGIMKECLQSTILLNWAIKY